MSKPSIDFGEGENTNLSDVHSAMVLFPPNKRVRRDSTSCSDHMDVQTPPIHRLPTEVLLEIFLWGVTIESVCGGFSMQCFTIGDVQHQVFIYPHYALRLSGVCRLWRSITTSCPRLWSCHAWDINLDDLRTPGLTTLISRYLELSKPLPLYLRLYCVHKPVTEIAREVLSHRARLRILVIRSGYYLLKFMEEELKSLGPRPVEGHFPNLVSFELEDDLAYKAGAFVRGTDIFSVAPKLRSLLMTQFGGPAFPYSQIETYTHWRFGITTDWQQLSRICPRLKSLVLRGGCCRWDVPQTLPSPVVFPSLTDVRFELNDFEPSVRMSSLAVVWKTFVMPSLQTVCIYSKEGYKMNSGSPVLNDLKEFFSQLSCPLRGLRFDWVEISVPDLHEILQMVPQLTQLRLVFPLDDDVTLPSCSYSGFIDLLAFDGDGDGPKIPLLPCLTYLKLVMMVDVDLMERITALLHTNWRGELSLKTRGTKDRPIFIPQELNTTFKLNLPEHFIGEFEEILDY